MTRTAAGTDIKWLYEGLVKFGVQPKQIDHKISSYDFAGADLYLAIEDYIDLFEWGTEILKNPHLSLLLARDYDSRHFGPIGYLSKAATNLQEFYTLVETYQGLVMEGKSWHLHLGEAKSELEYCVHYPGKEKLRLDVELSISLAVEQIRREFSRDWNPIRINFCHQAKSPTDNYVQLLGPRVAFNQPRNSIVFDNALLTQPLNNSDPRLLQILIQHADQQMQEIDYRPDFIQEVRLLLTANLDNKEFTIESLAHHLNITTRTVHRRLQKHNTSFRSLREESMVAAAKDLLASRDISVTLVAQQLGYSETSAFIRAFKRLVGESPRQFQRGAELKSRMKKHPSSYLPDTPDT